jgi:hypothetical protein
MHQMGPVALCQVSGLGLKQWAGCLKDALMMMMRWIFWTRKHRVQTEPSEVEPKHQVNRCWDAVISMMAPVADFAIVHTRVVWDGRAEEAASKSEEHHDLLEARNFHCQA